jgi:hypothetical protein
MPFRGKRMPRDGGTVPVRLVAISDFNDDVVGNEWR